MRLSSSYSIVVAPAICFCHVARCLDGLSLFVSYTEAPFFMHWNEQTCVNNIVLLSHHSDLYIGVLLLLVSFYFCCRYACTPFVSLRTICISICRILILRLLCENVLDAREGDLDNTTDTSIDEASRWEMDGKHCTMVLIQKIMQRIA